MTEKIEKTEKTEKKAKKAKKAKSDSQKNSNFEVKNNATMDTNVVTTVVNSSIETTAEFLEPITRYWPVSFNTVRNNKNRLYHDKTSSKYNFFKSFRYAGQGLYWAFITEPNVRIQMIIGLIFFGINLYYGQLILAVANLVMNDGDYALLDTNNFSKI